MSNDSEWWEPNILAKQEKELRKILLANNFAKAGDFESYKAIKEGVALEDSNLVYHNLFQEKRLKQVLHDYVNLLNNENCRTPNTIADLGCGAGFTTNALKNVYLNSLVFGYEISHDAIFFAKKNFPRCNFEQKQIDPKFALSEIKFDLIICQEFYPFTRTKNLAKHIEWVQFLINNLNKDGIALITVTASNLESINCSYKTLKNNFNLQKYTFLSPRISLKLPLILSKVLGKFSVFAWRRLGRHVFLLKN